MRRSSQITPLALALVLEACAGPEDRSPPRASARADAGAPPRPDAAVAPMRPSPVPDAAVTLRALPGRDFGPEVRETFRRLFCADGSADPACQRVAEAIAEHRRTTLFALREFLKTEWTGGPPGVLLYPFSGGDLVSALAAFPGAERVVLLSLEKGGPPAPLDGLAPERREAIRRRFAHLTARQVKHGYSHTKDLQSRAEDQLPGILPMLLLGLRVHGGEPTGLRYFAIDPGGEVRWLEKDDLATSARKPGRSADHTGWGDPGFNAPWSHLALRFRLPGDVRDREAWHVTADLSNPGFAHTPALEAFLRRLGRTTVMIKAASYLLLKDRYSRIRDVAFAGADAVLADNSAPDPRWLRRQGFELRLHGRFLCPVIRDYRALAAPWVAEFARAASAPLPFVFGYRDCGGRAALILGHRR